MSKLQYEVFQRSPQFEQAAAEMRMRPLDWQLLLALDGRARLGDLAQHLLVDVEEAVDAIAVCERLGLVERRRISLAEGRAEFEIPSADATPALPSPEHPVLPAAPKEPASLVELGEPVAPGPLAAEQPAQERSSVIATEPVPGLEADPRAGVAAVPIEFKLKPAVQVLIR
jgi:hypothetical protein